MENFAASWRIRRACAIGTLLFCAAVIAYLVGFGEDTELNRVIATNVSLVALGTLGSYVFGATWDSKNERDAEIRSRNSPRYSPRRPSPADEPPEGFAS